MTLTRDEILEMAGLDGFGLLDPTEREIFEAALRSAESDVKVEVRQVQDTVLRLETAALPDIEPEPALRGRVVGSVCRLIEEDFSRTLSEDGVSRPGGGRSPAGRRVGFFRGGVSPVWRVAALVFMTCSLFLSWLAFDVISNSARLIDAYVTNTVDQLLHEELGANALEILLHPESERVVFSSGSPDSPELAMFTYVASKQVGYFVADNLPESDLEYQLCVSPGEDGSDAQRLAAFTSDGGTIGVAVEFTESEIALAEGYWWVLGPSIDGSGPAPVLSGRL